MKTKCIPITLITYTLTENWHKEKLKVIENTNPHAIPDLIFRLALVIFHQYAIQKLWTTLRLALQKIQQKMDNVKLINALKFRDLKVLIKPNRLEVVKEKVNLQFVHAVFLLLNKHDKFCHWKESLLDNNIFLWLHYSFWGFKNNVHMIFIQITFSTMASIMITTKISVTFITMKIFHAL